MNRQYTLLSLLSGILLTLPWLGLGGITLFVAYIPLLYINEQIVERKHGFVPLYFSIYAFLSVFIWNLLSTWWLAHATIGGAAFAILVNSILMTIVLTMVHYAYRAQRQGFGNLFFIFAWLSFEYLHYHWELAWPWLNLGMGFANNVKIIQWYEYTGIAGGTVWVLIINLILWKFIKTIKHKQPINLYGFSLGLISIVLPVLISLNSYYRYPVKEGAKVNIVISQPNIDPFTEKFDESTYISQYQRLIEMAASHADKNVDLFLGPETSLHDVWQGHEKEHPGIGMIQHFLEDYPDAVFVSGAMTLKAYDKQAEHTESARISKDSSLWYDAYNSVLMISEKGVQDVYHKTKLAAGVERIPYQRYLNIFERMVVGLGGVTGTLAQGKRTNVFEKKGSKFGVPICSESIFGEYVSGFVKNGAAFLLVVTNDGWCKTKPGYTQHFAFSRILAIEHRRSIARAANTGISAFINQKGEIIQQSEWNKRTALKGRLYTNEKQTFYTRNGDFIGRISLFMFLLMGIRLLVKVRK